MFPVLYFNNACFFDNDLKNFLDHALFNKIKHHHLTFDQLVLPTSDILNHNPIISYIFPSSIYNCKALKTLRIERVEVKPKELVLSFLNLKVLAVRNCPSIESLALITEKTFIEIFIKG